MPMLEYLQKRGASGLRVLAPALSETEPKHRYFLGDVGSYTTLGPLGCKDSSSLTSGIPKKQQVAISIIHGIFEISFVGKQQCEGLSTSRERSPLQRIP